MDTCRRGPYRHANSRCQTRLKSAAQENCISGRRMCSGTITWSYCSFRISRMQLNLLALRSNRTAVVDMSGQHLQSSQVGKLCVGMNSSCVGSGADVRTGTCASAGCSADTVSSMLSSSRVLCLMP